MNEWNATTMTMAEPRRLLSARLDLDMRLRTAPPISKLEPSSRPPPLPGRRRFPIGAHYALIRRPHNEQAPCRWRTFPCQCSKSKADRGVHIHSRSPGRRAYIDGESTQRVSLRAELLRLALRFFKRRHGRRTLPPATVRARLKRIE